MPVHSSSTVYDGRGNLFQPYAEYLRVTAFGSNSTQIKSSFSRSQFPSGMFNRRSVGAVLCRRTPSGSIALWFFGRSNANECIWTSMFWTAGLATRSRTTKNTFWTATLYDDTECLVYERGVRYAEPRGPKRNLFIRVTPADQTRLGNTYSAWQTCPGSASGLLTERCID